MAAAMLSRKAGQHEDNDQHDKATFPVVRQVARQQRWHFAALKVVREDGKAQQQA
jgi:hypothetical protein